MHCQYRLGIGDADGISTEYITVSSSWNSKTHGTSMISLNNAQNPDAANFLAGAWRPGDDDQDPWVQVDLDDIVYVSGIVTQGRITTCDWVSQFKVKYTIPNDTSTTMYDATPKQRQRNVCILNNIDDISIFLYLFV